MNRTEYNNSLCAKCDNDVCKVYGGRCKKYCIVNFFRRLFCKHNYTRIIWYEEYDKHRNQRYSMRLYQCNKCGKEIWVDGRYDYILWEEIKKYSKKFKR